MTADTETAQEPQRRNYLTAYHQLEGNHVDLRNISREEGERGWELISTEILPPDQVGIAHLMFIFKRPKDY